MLRYVALRTLWIVPTLLGISLLTFLLLDRMPSDRAELAIESSAAAGGSQVERAAAVRRLQVRYGLVDPATGERRSAVARWANWVGHAVRFDFAGPGENERVFRRRFVGAFAVSALLGLLAVLLAFGIGVPLGSFLGVRRGGGVDRSVSSVLLVLWVLPDFLVATLLLLTLAGGYGPALLPGAGLRSPGAEEWSIGAQLADFGLHLVLPTVAIALGPLVIVTRLVRESVARAARAPFASALRGWGCAPRELRRAVLRNGLAPVATVVGSLLPVVVTGSVVVENVFAIPGLGKLAFDAIAARDYAAVMATTLVASLVTLVGMLVSDVLHRVVDPRVELR